MTEIVVAQMDRARDILSNHRRHLGVIRKEDALAAMLAYAQERVDAALAEAVMDRPPRRNGDMPEMLQTERHPPMTTPIEVAQMDRARDILSNHRRHLGVIRKEDALAAMLAYAQEARHAALADAVEVVRAERLVDDTGEASDRAYNAAIDDALAAIEALRSQP